MARFQEIVLGLGAAGSAALYHLAAAGRNVLGIDQYDPPHRMGSTHGETRITRLAIGEGVDFAPLAIRSHDLWRRLEKESGQNLLDECGCLNIPRTGGDMETHGVTAFMQNIRNAAHRYDIPHHWFATGAELRARYPQFAVADDDVAFLDARGGFVRPEACVAAHIAVAKRNGAKVLVNTKVTGFSASSGVRVMCADGQTYEADRLLITAGPWLPDLVGGPFSANLRVTRQVLHWFEIRSNAERFDPRRCPTYIWDVKGRGGATSGFYGFPLLGDASHGVKIAHGEDHGAVDPDSVPRTVTREEVDVMYETYVAPYLPDLGPRSLRTEVCMYTRQDAARFIIDWHPQFRERVLVASACSGHGFKHSAALGENLAAMLTGDGTAPEALAPFGLERLKQAAAA